MIVGSSAFEAQQRAATARFQQRRGRRDENIRKIRSGDWLSVGDPDRVRAWLLRRGMSDVQIEQLMAAHGTPTIAITESLGVAEPQALERVIGTSDLMGVAFLERGLQVSQTVGRVWVDVAAGRPRGYGTGFLVSPRLLLTNHHVLETAAVAANSAVQFNYQLGLDGQECPPAHFRLRPDMFFINSEPLDYALVGVAPASDQGGRALGEFGFNPIFPEEGKAIEAQWLNIIQHPGGGFKQLAFRENRLVDVFDAFLVYDTDTAQGSSGSPVYNDRWEVVGLHHAGVTARDAQGRTLAVDGQVWTPQMGEDRVKWIANEGIRISRIVADLRQRAGGPQAQGLIEEMLNMAVTPPERPERASPAPASPAAPLYGEAGGTVGSDGSATWLIPLRVTVQVGGGQPIAQAAAPAAPVAPQGVSSTPPTGDAKSPFEAALSQARSTLAGRAEVLDVRAGYVFKDGWITREPAIVVKVRKRQAPAALRAEGVSALPYRIDGVPVEVVNPTLRDLLAEQLGVGPDEALAAEGLQTEEIVYEPPPGGQLSTLTARMRVRACVSPDRGWHMLETFLAGAQRSLVVGMYDFGAKHIAAAIEQAAGRRSFRKFTLAMQGGSSTGSGTKANDLTDEQMVDRLSTALGAKFENSWIKVGMRNGWVATSYHIKVAVRDQQSFWLSSGNWQSSNQPDQDPFSQSPQDRSWLDRYNRDWHMVVDHPGLARTFETYIQNDYQRNLPRSRFEALSAFDVVLPGAVVAPMLEEATRPFTYFDLFDEDRDFTVTPLLTPDNYLQALIDLIEGAERELFIQNQTFNAATASQQDLGRVLSAVQRRQDAGVDVRIIFRVLNSSDARENLEALQDLGFDMQRVKVQKNCHTKGVMVDGRQVLIGSQNISQLGVTLNRDASLLFDDPGLTAYFRKIFLHDWDNVARRNIGSEHHAPELISAAGETPPGMERLSWKDLMEMA